MHPCARVSIGRTARPGHGACPKGVRPPFPIISGPKAGLAGADTITRRICSHFRIPLANAKGWSDINGRAAMMARFQKWEERALLECGGFPVYNGDT